MKRLTDNLNSDYIASANRLRPKGTRKRIVAYVESYEDISFWRNVLDEWETDKFFFEVMLPSRTTLGKGKKTALMNDLGKGLGQWMIACVDADMDWLLQGHTAMSRMLCESHYVMHTYAYAIENLQCWAPALHSACTMATLNDHELLDPVQFMEEYSRIIWPLLVWLVWCYRNDHYNRFSLMDMSSIVSFRDVNPYHVEQTLEHVRKQVNRRIAWLQHNFPEAKSGYPKVRENLLQMGLTPETSYMYIHGHSLWDGVVMPLLEPVCVMLRRYREKEIQRLAEHNTQRQNELSAYQHAQSPLNVILRKSTAYRQSPQYQWISADLRRLMTEVGEAK